MKQQPNIVRLLGRSSAPKRRRTAKPVSPKMQKLAIRLLESLNGPLRMQTQYRGDLSQIVMDAVAGSDLKSMALVDIREPKAAETCVMLSLDCLDALKKAAKVRGTSLNTIANTAVAHWLAARKAVLLRE
jgi:hypothetical protein